MTKAAYYPYKFGILKIEYADDAILTLGPVAKIDTENELSPLTDIVYEQVVEYLDGKRQVFDFLIEPKGTEFQKKVWAALCEIPYGETRTYKDIAIAIGNEKASRAVGMANNKNPIGIVVPCHRVIGSSGKLIGYANGLEMKKELLTLEQEHK